MNPHTASSYHLWPHSSIGWRVNRHREVTGLNAIETPESFRLFYSNAKTAFITVRIIASLDYYCFLASSPLAQNPLGLISRRKQKMQSGHGKKYRGGLEENPSKMYKQ